MKGNPKDTHPNELLGIAAEVDDIGIVTIRKPYFADSFEEALRVGEDKVAGVPQHSRSVSVNEAGIFIVEVRFEGKGSVETEQNEDFTLKTTFREEPIESHPKILEIIKKYGGKLRNGRVEFSDTYAGAASDRGLQRRREDGTVKNPFFGVEKYMVLEVTWTRRYAAEEIPGDILARVGRIVPRPPGKPPVLPGRNKWLVMPPSATRRGNMVEVTEEYQLLNQDTPDELYLVSER